MSPQPNILLFTTIAFFGALAIAIAAQILWTHHRKKRRHGFPIDPPRNPPP